MAGFESNLKKIRDEAKRREPLQIVINTEFMGKTIPLNLGVVTMIQTVADMCESGMKVEEIELRLRRLLK